MIWNIHGFYIRYNWRWNGRLENFERDRCALDAAGPSMDHVWKDIAPSDKATSSLHIEYQPFEHDMN